jgi:hypothetical protein
MAGASSGRGTPQTIQPVFAGLLTLQFITDRAARLVDIAGWNHGAHVRQVIGRRTRWSATAIIAIFPGVAEPFCTSAFTYCSS